MYHQELLSAKYLQQEESTAVAARPTIDPDRASDVPYTRGLIELACFIPIAAAWYYLLPWLQAPLIPTLPADSENTWLILPTIGHRFIGCLGVAGITTWLVLTPLRRRWKAEDKINPRPPRLADRFPIIWIFIYIMIVKYLVISGTFLALYLYSWDTISPRGIDVHLPWGARSYAFSQVRSLQLEPRGHLPFADKRDKYGYDVTFADGRTLYFTLKCEGLSESDVSTIATFLAKQTGKTWQIKPDRNGRRR